MVIKTLHVRELVSYSEVGENSEKETVLRIPFITGHLHEILPN